MYDYHTNAQINNRTTTIMSKVKIIEYSRLLKKKMSGYFL